MKRSVKSAKEYGHDKFCKRFENLKLKRFEHINLKDLASVCYYSGLYEDKISWNVLLKIYVLELFFLDYDIRRKGKERIVILFSNSYSSRKDYQEDINKVISCIDSYCFIGGRRKFRISLRRILNSFLVLGWTRKLKRANIRTKDILFCCSNFLEAINTLDEIKRIGLNYNKTRIFLSYCDFHVSDYYLVDFFKRERIKTATLQHGNYSHFFPYPFEISKSDYWLAINDYNVREGQVSGYDIEKMIVVGSMRNIGNLEKADIILTKKGIIGIALTDEQEDDKLLDFSEMIIKNYPYEIMIRPHPGSALKKHNIWNYSLCKLDDADAHSLNEFYGQCDFLITGNSSVFGDIIGKGYPIYRMITEGDIYECVDAFKFSKWTELVQIIENFYGGRCDASIQRDLKKYQRFFSPYADVAVEYKAFFSKFT